VWVSWRRTRHQYAAKENPTLLKQYYLDCLAHASSLIADATTGTAVVVDPQHDIDQHLADAQTHGWPIRDVFSLHFRADFLARQAQADYAFRPLHDGETLTFGPLQLTVLETPGHTPEAISILVYDCAKDPCHPLHRHGADAPRIGDGARRQMNTGQVCLF
jgi:hydroxyacylglutathione hydrolase